MSMHLYLLHNQMCIYNIDILRFEDLRCILFLSLLHHILWLFCLFLHCFRLAYLVICLSSLLRLVFFLQCFFCLHFQVSDTLLIYMLVHGYNRCFLSYSVLLPIMYLCIYSSSIHHYTC